jgi:hypothetical protein
MHVRFLETKQFLKHVWAERYGLDKMEAAINKGAFCLRACVHVRRTRILSDMH